MDPFELDPSWREILKEELQKPYIQELAAFLDKERKSGAQIYPPKEMVFNAFLLTPYDKVRVLIMGQDPYHGPGQAHGLCFSVPEGVPPPPSLQNIFKELASDLEVDIPKSGNLAPWAKQGVMLLNATLTVREGDPLSHHGKGWERFTDSVIQKLCERKDPIIFVLWGKSAKEKVEHICKHRGATPHTMLTAAHPSPLSAYRGFFGCRHFSKINQIFKEQNKESINWNTIYSIR